MIRLLAVLFPLAALAGCIPQPAPGIDSPEPALRLDAIRAAVARHDQAAVPPLIALLDSDDPATRLFAIRALENLTGETLGYDYAAPERERNEAAARWAERARAGTMPAAPGGDGTPGR